MMWPMAAYSRPSQEITSFVDIELIVAATRGDLNSKTTNQFNQIVNDRGWITKSA